ncbi:Similar to Gbeta76C: Guanine nucleotide-binding protein subunit beta-2 (Drosophila melanogaster) [Cotesia congregata]|uniref:Similar to Gbeta76C: Guanine nucleotide-binding protein subunit beta-2 (Drosophila melanogaster) n=1 Tax=Cotesia congregata TaxID=51543 RepID=A0A8J2MRN1_COTCN|nr:Similar to Gbeta76C: Guanine nucleotide-binding protein subunit beta-2 (Drosophila melanogaster) [Cotesia congregata]
MGKDDAETTALKKELDDLIKKCQEDQKKQQDTTLEEACSSVADAPKIKLSTKKLLKGHINKVNSVHYSGDSRHCVTGSLDGKLIIWDSWTGNKVQVIPLRSAWVMSVAFAPSGNFVACGGMDNMCTVYDVNNRDATGSAKITRELLGYEDFCAHAGDVVSISLSPDGNSYITGSVDKTCKLWDMREEKAKQTFFGHEADVNSVCFHPSGYSFVTASEDKTARMWDLRSDQQLATYKPPSSNPGYTSCGLSLSGRYIFCASDDNSIHIWDTLKGQYNGALVGHENRVTSLSVAPNGMAVASCSWDQYVRVWV